MMKLLIQSHNIFVYYTNVILYFADNGEVFIWGCGSEGQLGLGNDIDKQIVPAQLSFDDKVLQLACGYYHTMFVTGNEMSNL